jgi:glycosyltransferase involved in cell wall biosynthesis
VKVIIIENENFRQHRIGGISSYIQALLQAFEMNELSYCCVGAGFENEGPDQTDELKIYSISGSAISNLCFFLRLLFAGKKIFSGIERAVFHFHHPYMALALRSFKRKNTFVLTLHSKQDQSFRNNWNGFYGFLYDYITRKSIRLYDGIIADNKWLLDHYHKKFGFDLKRASIISPPVDTDVFKPQNKSVLRQKYNLNEADKLILFAGRIEKQKNLELLFRACRLLINEKEIIKLWIVGDGSELQNLQKIANEIDIKEVAFKGNVNRNTLSEFMNCANVFALTSLQEGGPIVVKEALACNLPVVSVDVGDVAELLSGLEGCFISSYDEKEFAECMRKVVEYDGDRNFRDAVLKYSVEEFGRKVVEVYDKEVGSKK